MLFPESPALHKDDKETSIARCHVQDINNVIYGIVPSLNKLAYKERQTCL